VVLGGTTGPPTPKISARGIERTFEAGSAASVQALGPLDLDIAAGEFVCVVGPSGCGKSTFLRILAGLLRPSAGIVRIDADPTAASPTAMVFQDYSVFPWKRVIDNVTFGLAVSGVPRREARARAQRYLDRLGLGDWAAAYPANLSGGMRQRVSIARALAVEPEILLMDEPFAAVDAQLRTVLQDELLALWQSDRRTVVFITHSLEEAILLGDRVVVMSARPGRVLRIVDVPFPRPRDAHVRTSAAFAELQGELWDLLRVEVDRVLAARGELMEATP
jgi:NitT/TauT family transport system ATP-binding protein